MGATSLVWSFGDSSTATSGTVTHTYDSTGTYILTLTVTNGTCGSSQTDTIHVTGFVGINEVNNLQVNLEPNPVKDVLTIHFPDFIANAYLEISNCMGQLVYGKNIEAVKNRTSVNLESFASGVYFLKIGGDNKVAVLTLSKGGACARYKDCAVDEAGEAITITRQTVWVLRTRQP